MQRTALQYWVCTRKQSDQPCWLQIASLKWSTPNDPLFSLWIRMWSLLCVASAWFFDICIEGEWRTRGCTCTWVGGCDSGVVIDISSQLHVTCYHLTLIFIVLSDSSRHWHVLLSAGCHCFSCFICHLWNVKGQRWQRIAMRCILYVFFVSFGTSKQVFVGNYVSACLF